MIHWAWMQPEDRRHADEIWTILRDAAKRMDRAEERTEVAHREAIARAELAEKRSEADHQKAIARAELAEKRAEADHQKAIKRAELAEKRSEADHQKAMKRVEAAEKRMEKFDQRLEATRRLVEAGMKIVVRLDRRQGDLEKTQKAFMDWLRKGGNGNGRKHP